MNTSGYIVFTHAVYYLTYGLYSYSILPDIWSVLIQPHVPHKEYLSVVNEPEERTENCNKRGLYVYIVQRLSRLSSLISLISFTLIMKLFNFLIFKGLELLIFWSIAVSTIFRWHVFTNSVYSIYLLWSRMDYVLFWCLVTSC